MLKYFSKNLGWIYKNFELHLMLFMQLICLVLLLSIGLCMRLIPFVIVVFASQDHFSPMTNLGYKFILFFKHLQQPPYKRNLKN